MKFTTRFEDDLQEVGWEEYYLRYRQLKHFIKELSLNHHNSKHHSAVHVNTQVSLPPLATGSRLMESVNPSTLSCDPTHQICVECDAGEREFCRMITDDMNRISEFVCKSLVSREEMFSGLNCDLDLAISAVKDEYARRGVEPMMMAHTDAEHTLASLAVWIDDLGALRQFVLVNREALKKITKKFCRWCNSSFLRTAESSKSSVVASGIVESCIENKTRVDSIVSMSAQSSAEASRPILPATVPPQLERYVSSGEDIARVGFTSPRHGGYSDEDSKVKNQESGTGHALSDAEKLRSDSVTCKSRIDSVIADLFGANQCDDLLNSIQMLRSKAVDIEMRIMASCSTYHDFLQDHRMLLHLENERTKMARVHKGKSMLVRNSLDLETGTHPSVVLLMGITLPMLTLAATYSLTSNLYIDEEETIKVFEHKGYFISASIDRAPASNVGTLGLTTTLMFLSVIIFVKHKIIKKQLRGRVWTITRRTSLIVGMLAIFSGNGVAAFQHQDHAVAHNTFAALFFTSGMLHIVLETVMDHANKLSTLTTRRVRGFMATMLIVCVALFLLPMGYVMGGYCVAPACDVVALKRVAALCEVLAFIIFILWFASYYPIIRQSNFEIQVHRRVVLGREMYLRERALTTKAPLYSRSFLSYTADMSRFSLRRRVLPAGAQKKNT